ncbi:MAG TPA: peptidylprolyl isomerase [Acetobacteraceae bacterium]
MASNMRGRASRHWLMAVAVAAVLAVPCAVFAAPAAVPAGKAAVPGGKPGAPAQAPLAGTRIVAVVNGDVISNGDVDNRARLFAMSTGLPMAADVLDRLKPQIVRQLVDERLRMQEAQRTKIVIGDQQIANAIQQIEQRNGMPAGALRQKLAADGVSQRTLIDQIRAQLAWTQVLHDQMTAKVHFSNADVDELLRLQAQQVGKPEYRVAEIFIPVDDPANTADAERFAETVIKELHAGAPFPIVAAQFSQAQSALEGGELGWVQTNQLDPEVARLVNEMPVGAVSNPVKVPGGFSIITLQGKREVGRDSGTVVTVRQAFLAFPTPLNPQAPTDQQRQVLAKAHSLSNSVHGCDQMEQVAKANSPNKPADPGEIRVDAVHPAAFQKMLMTLPIGKASEPLVAQDGIAVLVICTRGEKNMAAMTREEAQQKLVADRLELMSRQLLRDLHREATIEIRQPQVNTAG